MSQRSVASKGYYETITWSFCDEKTNEKFRENIEKIEIINPISSDLNVLRNSLFPNLIYYMEKNINRGFGDQSLFEIGPLFTGKNPGDQITVICGIKKQNEEDKNQQINYPLNVFEIKKDVVQTFYELGDGRWFDNSGMLCEKPKSKIAEDEAVDTREETV